MNRLVNLVYTLTFSEDRQQTDTQTNSYIFFILQVKNVHKKICGQSEIKKSNLSLGIHPYIKKNIS